MNVQPNINAIVNEINYCINILYFSPFIYSRGIALNQLMNKMSLLNKYTVQGNTMALITDTISQRDFTIEELSKFNGRDDKPAYIAINSNVYDVTNNAAWAAGTHFGLSAGRDLTNEFASCHKGQQQILSRLKVVGRLV